MQFKKLLKPIEFMPAQTIAIRSFYDDRLPSPPHRTSSSIGQRQNPGPGIVFSRAPSTTSKPKPAFTIKTKPRNKKLNIKK